jgi:hypothetical protein
MELWQHSATELAALFTGRQVSCRDVARAHLDRIDAINGQLNAPSPCQLVCQIWPSQKSDDGQQACDQHFRALGGIRTPNLLIRRKVRLSQWVAPVPPWYNKTHRETIKEPYGLVAVGRSCRSQFCDHRYKSRCNPPGSTTTFLLPGASDPDSEG